VQSMGVWLSNRDITGRTALNLTSANRPADDGETENIEITPDGRWVVFESTSQEMAPTGIHTCPTCIDGPSYIYLYDTQTHTLTPVPPQPDFGPEPQLRDPVISENGEVVAFEDNGRAELWYPRQAVVRAVDEIDEPHGADNANSLAISGDGSVLANDTVEGVTVVHLGGLGGPDTLLWSYPYSQPWPPERSAALSANGSELTFIAPTPSGLYAEPWLVNLPSGTLSRLPPPPLIPPAGAPQPTQGIATIGRISITADGSQILAAGCPFQSPPTSQDACLNHMHLYRWSR
jgi:hypothetical protein